MQLATKRTTSVEEKQSQAAPFRKGKAECDDMSPEVFRFPSSDEKESEKEAAERCISSHPQHEQRRLERQPRDLGDETEKNKNATLPSCTYILQP